MAAVVPPADVADLLKNLSLDSQTKKSFADIGNSQVQPSSFIDPAMLYFSNGYLSTPCYYGGFDGATNNWSDYRYVNPSGVDLAHGVYGYGYALYGPYSPAGSPVPTVGQDGQLYGSQNYQYTSPYFQQSTPISGPYSASSLTASSTNGNFYSVGPKGDTAPMRPTSYQNLAYDINGSQNGMNLTTGYMNQAYPNKLYGQYGNTCQSGYGTKDYGLQTNVSGWSAVDNKFKLFGYTNANSDGLNELNRGPRTITTKNQKPITLINTTLSSTDGIEKESKEVKEVNITPDREQYKKTEFPETYADAKFFIIKSYSEDDVHKSIKYNVWSSTQNGNKKLDVAYQEAKQKSEPCPVFLFFSVNTSGQFVGVAEMVGPVDFNKNLDYWQQDKWIGCFPVKWHIVKDVHNCLLRHIVLEYNENKPVTNSRDTQEVKLEHGLQMIKIFKEHSGKQCVLDDFQFYENRQKKILEIKGYQQRFQKHAWEGKPAIVEKFKEGVEDVKSDDVACLVNEVKLADCVEDIGNEVAKGC